ncbi:MAG: hypothetical protein WBO28_12875 [Flavobacteriales bacterium]|jgi:hypothetical protein|nr:hypothetical protein [Flavobacteriales bacterium]
MVCKYTLLFSLILASGVLDAQTEVIVNAGPTYTWIGQNAVSDVADADIDAGLGGWRSGIAFRLPWPQSGYFYSGLCTEVAFLHRAFGLTQTLKGQKNTSVRTVDIQTNNVELYAGPWWRATDDGTWWFSVGPAASFMLGSQQKGELSLFNDDKLVKGPELLDGSATGTVNDVSFSLQGRLFWNKQLSEKFKLYGTLLLSRSFTSPLVEVGALHMWEAHLTAGVAYVFPAKPGTPRAEHANQ